MREPVMFKGSPIVWDSWFNIDNASVVPWWKRPFFPLIRWWRKFAWRHWRGKRCYVAPFRLRCTPYPPRPIRGVVYTIKEGDT